MNLATEILVIIVSVFLTLFLIASIVVLILAAKLIKQVRLVVAKAEHVVDNVEHIGTIFEQASGRLAWLKIVQNIVKMVKK